MTVLELKNNMNYDEFQGWMSYFEERPIGWREDYRTYLFLKTQGYSGKPEAIFPSLQKIFNSKSKNPTDSLKGSSLFNKLMSAKDGDTIPISGDL